MALVWMGFGPQRITYGPYSSDLWSWVYLFRGWTPCFPLGSPANPQQKYGSLKQCTPMSVIGGYVKQVAEPVVTLKQCGLEWFGSGFGFGRTEVGPIGGNLFEEPGDGFD